MPQITRDSLMTLEGYAKVRPEMRAEVMAHKKNRMVELGDHVTLIFEDEKTMRYQIQEMLRAERTFEESGIQDELNAYNPLVPDGTNWESHHDDPVLRPGRAQGRAGPPQGHRGTRVGAGGRQPKVFAIADEDMERENEEKTRRCTSCASNSIPPRSRPPNRARLSAWVSITKPTRWNR